MSPAEKLAFLRDRLVECKRESDAARAGLQALEQEAEALEFAIASIQSQAAGAEGVALVLKQVNEAAAMICPPVLSEKHKRLLGALRDVARDGLAEASYTDLSYGANLTKASVRAGLAHLMLTGFIALVRKGRGEGSSRYRILVNGFGETPTAKARAA